MREFSTKEKEIIKNLVDARDSEKLKNLLASKYFYNRMSCHAIEWDSSKGNEKVVFYNANEKPTISEELDALDILTLFEYLEKNGYVLVMEQSNCKDNRLYDHTKYEYKFGSYLEKGGMSDISKTKSIFHSKVAKLFEKYSNSYLYPTTELKDYVDRGFKTKHDCEFKSQQKVAIISIIVAIIVCIITMFVNCHCSKQATKLDVMQYENLIKSINYSATNENLIDK